MNATVKSTKFPCTTDLKRLLSRSRSLLGTRRLVTSLLLILLVVLVPAGFLAALPQAHATITDGSWTPHVSCQAQVTTDHGVIGNHFDPTTEGALESGGPYGAFATNQSQIGSSSDLQPDLTPPCTYPNVNGTIAPTFVEIHGISLTSGSSVESGSTGGKCGSHYQGINGGGSYPGGATFCTSYGVFQDTSEYTGNCETTDNPNPKICIRLEIDRDWFAAGFCGPGTVCDSTSFNNLALGQKIDVQGFVAWHPPSSAGHGYSSWEIHPLTAWRFTGSNSPPLVTAQIPTPNPTSTGTTVTESFTVSSTSTVTGVSVSWGDGKVDSLAGSVRSGSHVYATTGYAISQTFPITVSATNSAGTGSSSTTETVNDRGPAVSVGGISPNPVLTGATVVVSFSGSDPDGSISGFAVNWGDGSAVDTLPGTATSDSHSYSIAGAFTITVTGTDNSASTGQTSGSVTVQVPSAPIVSVNSPAPNPASTGSSVAVTFTVSSSAKISGITVNWGDGSAPDSLPGKATSDTHVYSSTGSATSQTFTITVTATNSGGSGSGTTTETVNDRSPTVSITNISPNPAVTGQAVTVAFSSADPDGTMLSTSVNFGDGTVHVLAGTATSDTHSYTTTGYFTVTVTVTDNSGSTAQASGTITISVPAGSPTVSVNSPTPNPANSGTTVTVSFTVNSTLSVTGIVVSWGDGSSDSLSGTATSDSHVYSSTGDAVAKSFTITVSATNSVGSGSGSTVETVNDRLPVVTVSNVSPNPGNAGSSVTLSFSATDPDGTVASFMVNWGDGSGLDSLPGAAVSDTHKFASAGNYSITVSATDNGGSTGSGVIIETVVTPLPPPTVVINSVSPNPSSTSAIVNVTFTVSSSIAINSITVSWGDGITDTLPGAAFSDSHVYLSTGSSVSQSFVVTVSATSSAGAGFASATETVNDQAPVVSITSLGPNPASTGISVTVNFTATDPDGSIASVMVNWGDATVDTVALSAHGDTHLYASTGNALSKTFTITVSVRDNSGSTATATTSETVNDRAPGVAITGVSPSPSNTGQTVSVTFSASDVDGTLSSVSVNWGDGTVHSLAGSVSSDAHSYSTAGTFTITIVVTDNAGSPGQSSTSQIVSMSTAPPYSLVVTASGQVYKFYQNGTLSLIGQPVTTPLRAVSWKPDGSSALIVGDFAVLLKWDGTSLTTISTPVTSGYNFWSVSWKQDGSYALIGGSVGILLRYDGASFAQINPGGATILSIAWNPSGAYAALAGKSGSFRTYNGSTVKAFTTGTTNDLNTVVWNPNGQYALIGGLNGAVLTFDGTNVVQLSTSGLTGTNAVRSIAFNSPGTLAVLVGDNGMVLTYNGSALTLLPTITGSWLYAVAFSPSGTAYIMGGSGTVLTYSNGTLAKLTTSPVTTLQFRAIAWKPQ